MKIGLVTGEYPPMEGGVGAYTQEMAKAFHEAGNEVHVITSRQAKPKVENRSMWDIREPYDLGYAQLHARAGRWWWSAMSTAAQIVARYDLDIVNIQYQAAAFDMNVPAINFLPWRLRGMTKTVVTFHDLRVPYLFPKAGRLREKMVRRLAHSADGVIVTNIEDYNTLSSPGPGTELMVQLPIGSNIRAANPSTLDVEGVRRSVLGSEEGILLGYFGFLNETKGADTLVDSLARLPSDYELVFVGGQTGSSDSSSNKAFLVKLRERISALKLDERVHWSGFLDEEDVSAYLFACDMIVMPYRDGASLRRGTLMAALAHGRPIITTEPTTPIDQLIHGENVWMTRVDDPVELSDAIAKLAADPALREMLAARAKETSAQFTWTEIAAKTVAFYKEIIASGS
jgi:glycosyltransferase involved in cell wall biosynthesis